MAEILTDMESAETFKAYESYLLGQPAKAGTVLRQGAFFYIWKEKFETDGTVLQTSYGTVVTTLDSESKTLFACREFLGGRRLPLGVTAAMTKAPKTVAATALASEALAILNRAAITVLLVVDADGRPAGLLHIHDCLKAGLA